MHSRIFLHRLSDQPRSSVPGDSVSRPLPFGFGDAPSTGPSAVPHRNPIGFGPPEPTFVTEVSFRRTATERIAPTAGVPLDGSAPGGPTPGLGHAVTWEGPVADDAALDPAVPEKKVPFYKREISLRRRKDVPTVVASADVPDDAAEVEPEVELERRGIGFVHTTNSTDAGDEPVAELPTADDLESVETDDETFVSAGETEPTDDVEPALELPMAKGHDLHETQDLVEEPLVELPTAEAYEIEWAEDVDGEPVSVEIDAAVEDIDELVEEPVAHADAEETAPFEDEHVDSDEHEHDPASVELPPQATEKPKKRGGRSSIRSRKGGTSASKRSSSRGGRKVVGLKVGASQIAAAVVSANDGRFELVQLARRPLDPGIIGDGEVRDPEAFKNALKAFFDENKLPRKDVRIGIASNRIGVRTFDIVGVDDQARFDNAVRFKAHEVLPVSVHESVLDYRVIDERVTETGDVVRRVLLAVAPRDQVEPFLTACRAANIRLAGVDLEALGLLRAFVEPHAFSLRTSSDTATVVVSIGHEATTLLVAGGGSAEFTRVFEWGGGVLQHAIAQELEVHPAEAATILKGLSLAGPGRSNLDETDRSRALEAVRARLTPFARELVSSLQFYQTQPDSLGIGEIVITGGTSHLEGLGDALHQMIGVAVRVGDPLARVVVRGSIDPSIEATLGSMAVPIGLAIEDEALRSVNLLPPELRNAGRRKASPLSIAIPLAAAVPIAALGLMFMQASDQVSEKQAQLGAVEAQIAALPVPTTPVIDAGLEVSQQQRAAALAAVLGSRLAWDRVLGDLSRVLPANVWLTKFTAMTPDPTAAALPAAATPGTAPLPTGVTLEGYTYALPDVARLLARLNTLPSLTNVVLGSSSRQMIGKRPAVSFSIIADIDTTGGAQ